MQLWTILKGPSKSFSTEILSIRREEKLGDHPNSKMAAKQEVGKDAQGWDVILVDHKHEASAGHQERAQFKASPQDTGMPGREDTSETGGISQLRDETIAASRIHWDDGGEPVYTNSSDLDLGHAQVCTIEQWGWLNFCLNI
jgi:hypothetical protein